MVNVAQIESVQELMKLWPRLRALSAEASPPVSVETALKIFLDCFGQGAVFVVRNDHGLVGSCCLHFTDHPKVLALRTLPKDNGEALGKVCLEQVVEWAKEKGYKKIVVTTYELDGHKGMSGSRYKYFEKSLGFRQQSVTFVRNL